MTALALSLDPAGRQPRGILGRHAAPPALAPERARELLPRRSDRQAGPAVAASLLLHLLVAGAALAAFGGETMGGAGGGAGTGEGTGILVELVAATPADASAATPAAAPEDAEPAEETREAEAPQPEAAPREVALPPPPIDAEAIPLNVPPPEPVETAKIEEPPQPVEQPKPVETPAEVKQETPKPVEPPKPTEAKPTEAKQEAPKPAPAKAKAPAAKPQPKPSETASAPATQAVAADTVDASPGQSANAGAPGAASMGGAGGDQVAALGGTGLRVLQARFRVTPPAPPYPRRALAMHQQGVVMIRALIDERGAAREIRLQASSGYPLLDRAALQAVEDWQFMPETVNGRPVAVWVEVPVRFAIN